MPGRVLTPARYAGEPETQRKARQTYSHPSWYGSGGIIADPIVTKNQQVTGFLLIMRILGSYSGTFIANAAGRLSRGGLDIIVLPPELVANPTQTIIREQGVEFDVIPLWATYRRSPLYGDEAHSEPKDGYTLQGFGWDRPYPASHGGDISVRALNFQMHSPIDLYRLRIEEQLWLDEEGLVIEDRGVPWYNPGAAGLMALIIYFCSCGKLDLNKELSVGRLVWSRPSFDKRQLFRTDSGFACFDTYTFATVLSDVTNIHRFKQQMATSGPWTRPQWDESVTDYLDSQLSPNPIGTIPAIATLDVVNGSVGDQVIQSPQHAVYLQGGVRGDCRYQLRRLNTTVSRSWANRDAEGITEILFSEGLDALLATDTQLALGEQAHPFEFDAREVQDATGTGEVDFDGAMGVYLREVFFHIPFVIADHLNSQGRFEDAQRWYHHIFDPTAADTIAVDPALTADAQRVRALDRNWRYREFRDRTADTLRRQLSNRKAIAAYARDPFNPHAVARLRLSAYQKAIVMKYVDNLLDWGDDLFMRAFSERNPERLRLASLKYVTAQEILGSRPALLGDCGEGRVEPKTYPTIKSHLDEDSEFLMEMESTIVVIRRRAQRKGLGGVKLLVDSDIAGAALRVYAHSAAQPAIEAGPVRTRAVIRAVANKIAELKVDSEEIRKAVVGMSKADYVALLPRDDKPKLSIAKLDAAERARMGKWAESFTLSFVTQLSPIFCVPGNERMLSYWDRVEDRLYKLRHCMDIDGVPRQLPLFAPPIDPGLLVGGRAAGLSLDDILGSAFGSLPPYRFRYLLDKAKGYAAAVQGFGAALLSALDKRDTEQLARLRNTHQKNILALTTEVKRRELDIAEEGVLLTGRKEASAQYRYDYYEGLVSAGLSAAEQTQRIAKITSGVLRGASAVLDTVAAIAYLVPQVGSPLAMKYGGKEIGDSGTTWGDVLTSAAGISDAVATIAGLEAGFQRREDGWEHQKKLADNDLKIIEKEGQIAELRKKIATRGLELHNKAKAQHDEVIELYEHKFSNLGLYTHLSRTLQQLYRQAYDNALAVARLAEQAFRFERPGDNTVFVGGEWDAGRSGLLAGERLNLALQRMERRFMETNARSAEINQSFSLGQLDPQALIALKEVGQCEFALPELLFDLFYPGQYRRRVRAVRLTIPCVTGPYTNVSAKLTLLSSQIRQNAVLGATNLLEVPMKGTTTVATSTAQGDAGVFELSFRDERYLPFEGAGAISTWRLELPAHFRPFDYQTINDVILNVSYTAEEDGGLRAEVESKNAAMEGSLLGYLSNNALTRVFSLRQEFSSAFNRLMQAPVGTTVTLDIDERHFPLFLQGRNLTAISADLVIGLEDRTVALGALAFDVNTETIGEDGTPGSAFPAPTHPADPDQPYGGLPFKSMTPAFAADPRRQHMISVSNPGGLAPAGAGRALDPKKLRDLLIVVRYRLA